MAQRIPAIITAIYLILVLFSIVPIFTGADALSSVFAVVLTAPWNSLLSNLLSLPSTMTTGLILVVVGAAINATIIYAVLRWLVGRFAE